MGGQNVFDKLSCRFDEQEHCSNIANIYCYFLNVLVLIFSFNLIIFLIKLVILQWFGLRSILLLWSSWMACRMLFYVTLARNRLDGGLWKTASVVFLFAGWPGRFCVCKKRASRVSVSFQILKILNGLGKWQNIFLLQTFLFVNCKPWQY